MEPEHREDKMAAFQEIKPEEMTGNVFDRIGKQWMLITAGNKQRLNTMTASWGGLGVLWGGPVAFIFVRPQRYTLEFLKQNTSFSLSFYEESHRKALGLLGSKSGRDGDKIAEAGLTPAFENGTPYFEEAKLALFCEKMYESHMLPASFKARESIEKWYPEHDYHHVLIGGITKVLQQG